MAADVLAYRTDEVPVGDDQRQHVELMREIARSFNARFGEILVVPEHRIPEVGARIMDLQNPTSKMSTTAASEEGTVYVLDEPARIERKFKRAVTDSGEGVRRSPRQAGHHEPDRHPRRRPRRRARRRSKREFASARYGDFKAAVAAAVVAYLAPVRERYSELRADEARPRGGAARGRRARARDRRRRRSPTSARRWASARRG